jgi:hypothetical protein
MKTLSEPVRVVIYGRDEVILLAVDDDDALIERHGNLQLVRLSNLAVEPFVRNRLMASR